MIRLRRDAFVELAARCYEELPPEILDYVENLDVVVEEWPSDDTLSETGTESPYGILGLYSGLSRIERGDDLPWLPDKITIYQRPIEAICATWEEVESEVRKTLLHEVGHYLGMDEDYLHRLGYA